MLMALRESKRGRKNGESRGLAAKAEVPLWREQGQERSGFGRKSAGSARAGGARRGHLGSCLRWPGEGLQGLAAADAPAPGAGPVHGRSPRPLGRALRPGTGCPCTATALEGASGGSQGEGLCVATEPALLPGSALGHQCWGFV